jgi:uncharacterized membrane protein
MIYFDQFLEIPLFAGILFLIIGIILFKFPPKKPNSFYGYRTTRSMHSLEAWQFSQKYAAVKMLQVAMTFVAISTLGVWFDFVTITPVIFGSCVLIAGLVFLIFSTELALKLKFPNKKS